MEESLMFYAQVDWGNWSVLVGKDNMIQPCIWMLEDEEVTLQLDPISSPEEKMQQHSFIRCALVD